MKSNAVAYARLIKYLMLGVHSCEELGNLTDLHYSTVLRYTRELHRVKAIHICDWLTDNRGHDCVKVYKLGTDKDAPRYKMPRNICQQRYRAKKALLAAQAALTLRPNVLPLTEIETA